MVEGRTINRIAIGADHGGFQLKEQIKSYLNSKGYGLEDCGAFSEEAVDYPRIAAAVARLVAAGNCERGIIIDGAPASVPLFATTSHPQETPGSTTTQTC